MDLTLALGLEAARANDPAAYAIGGGTPRAAVRPATRDELGEVLRACSRDRLAAVPWGGGVGLERDEAPGRYDVAIDLRAFDRVVEYDPEDMTLTAECGVTLAALGRTLAAHGQELPIEGGFAGRATLGGALAANAAGPRRLRFGSPRDRILGARFALSDGTLARTGGRVVKNVTGYALHRLLCGSRGGLAALVEASLKLVPAPAARAALVFHAGAGELRDERRWAGLPRLEPSGASVLGARAAAAVEGLPAGSEFTVVIVLEDEPAWVAQQAERIESALGRPVARLEGAAVANLTQALCDAPERMARALTLTTAWNSPAAAGVILSDPASPGLVHHFLAGRLHLEPESGSDNASSAVRRLAGGGFTLIEHRGCGPLEQGLPPLSALGALRGQIREGLDPAGVWAYGTRWEKPV